MWFIFVGYWTLHKTSHNANVFFIKLTCLCFIVLYSWNTHHRNYSLHLEIQKHFLLVIFLFIVLWSTTIAMLCMHHSFARPVMVVKYKHIKQTQTFPPRCDPSSPYVHHIGWCQEHDKPLTPPQGKIDCYRKAAILSWISFADTLCAKTLNSFFVLQE